MTTSLDHRSQDPTGKNNSEEDAAAPVPAPTATDASSTTDADDTPHNVSSVSLDKNKEKNARKAALKAEKEAKKAAHRLQRGIATANDPSATSTSTSTSTITTATTATEDSPLPLNFGDAAAMTLRMTSNTRNANDVVNVWTRIERLTPELHGQTVRIRGFLHKTSLLGKGGVFVLIRSGLYSVQGVAFVTKLPKKTNTNNNIANNTENAALPIANNVISAHMVQYIASLPLESVVDVSGVILRAPETIHSVTQAQVELHMSSFFGVVVPASANLPFTMDDACRKLVPHEHEQHTMNNDDDHPEEGEEGTTEMTEMTGHVGQKMRLDYRWLDLRTPANQAIFRIQSMVCTLFREFLLSHRFTEIHTPKLLGGASEGGSDVFTLSYFGMPACLAMSPQLHKQMMTACAGFERVFEIGPVFRAENSHTRRHLCEFTGLDLEMSINEHYDEVLHMMSGLFLFIFDGIRERCQPELCRVQEQHPFEELQYVKPTLKLTYEEGCALLRNEAGIDQDPYQDLSTEHEKKLGDIVKRKYGTDFFFMDKYPLSVRPFYTMPDSTNPLLSNSYDFFLRGQEIVSGAQRIHDPELLEARAAACGMDVSSIASYVNSFRNGALPHGGGGIGLERVVMLYLNLPNIRKTSAFPRDPKRLSP